MTINLRVGQEVTYCDEGCYGKGVIEKILIDHFKVEFETCPLYFASPDGYVISGNSYIASAEGEEPLFFYILKENFIDEGEKIEDVGTTGQVDSLEVKGGAIWRCATGVLSGTISPISNTSIHLSAPATLTLLNNLSAEIKDNQIIIKHLKDKEEPDDGITLNSMSQPQYEDSNEDFIENVCIQDLLEHLSTTVEKPSTWETVISEIQEWIAQVNIRWPKEKLTWLKYDGE